MDVKRGDHQRLPLLLRGVDDAETADQSVAGREGLIQSIIHHCQPLSIPVNNVFQIAKFPPFTSTVGIHRQIGFSLTEAPT
jgi:hypothetical protein